MAANQQKSAEFWMVWGEEGMIKELALNYLMRFINKKLLHLSKKIYPESEFEKHIDIDVRSSHPVNISLTKAIPEITIYLKITNKSPYLDVRLNKAEFSLLLKSDSGLQPLFNQFEITSPTPIKRGTSEEIFCQKELNESQVKLVKEIKESKEVTAELSPFKAWFESSAYPNMIIQTNLEDKCCRIG